MPLWVAVAIVAAAFAFRALLRGPSFDRTDALVLALFVVVLAVTAFVRRWIAAADQRERAGLDPDHGDAADDSPGGERESHDEPRG
jgi:hypothetical protein